MVMGIGRIGTGREPKILVEDAIKHVFNSHTCSTNSPVASFATDAASSSKSARGSGSTKDK